MTPLAWFLTLIVLASILFLLLGGWVAYRSSSSTGAAFKRAVTLYAIAVGFLLGGVVQYFIGWEASGSPHVPKSYQRRIAHAGYYFARDGQLDVLGSAGNRLLQTGNDGTTGEEGEWGGAQESEVIRQLMSADPTEEDSGQPAGDAGSTASNNANNNILTQGFFHPSLAPDEKLSLKPVWDEDKATEWSFTYKVGQRPLRLRSVENNKIVDKCVNISDEQWLVPGDMILLLLERGGVRRFITIKWTAASKYPQPFTRKTNAYHFGQGIIRGDVLEYEKGPELLMSERVLSDGIILSDLVRRARKDFHAQVGIIGQEWWDVLGGITLVREMRADAESRVGILLNGETGRKPGLRIIKNYRGNASQTLTPRITEETVRIPSTTVITYGLRGTRDYLEFKLTEEGKRHSEIVRDDVWGQIVHVNLGHPKAWALPPAPTADFIVTSRNDYIPLDGYFLDIGNSPHSFFAKARLNDSLDELIINDGRNLVKEAGASGAAARGDARRFPLERPASLGDYEQGVLISLIPVQAGGRYADLATAYLGAPYTGFAAAGLISLNVLIFVILAIRQKHDRPKLFLSWTLIWGVTLTLLTIRLVVAYRVSSIPPLDATLNEIRNVFDKGVDYSLGGFVALAILTVSLFFASRKSRKPSQGTLLTSVLLALWVVTVAAYTIFGSFLGTNQSFLIARISIVDHLLIVGGLALLAGRVLDHSNRVLTLLVCLSILTVLLLQIFVVQDAGAFLYALSLLFCVSVLWGWRKPPRTIWGRLTGFVARSSIFRRQRRWLSNLVPSWGRRQAKNIGKLLLGLAVVGLPVVAFSVLVILPYLIQTGWMRKIARPHLPDTTFYRLASFMDSEDAILMTKSGDEEVDMSKLLDNSRQDWQMLLYASHGAVSPVGYGRVPLSKVGMTYATSVSDCAFSTYLLAEHGKTAAVLLLVLYTLIAFSCVFGGWHLDDNVRHRNVVLLAIGGFFAINALYMAGANVGLFPFTGQNLPLLGLNSGGDIMQGLLLTWLAGWLLLNTRQESSALVLWQKHPAVLRTGILLLVLLVVVQASVYWRIGKIGSDTRYQEDHDFKPETFAQITSNLPPEGTAPGIRRNAPLVLDGTTLKRAPGGQIMEIEEQYVKQFNDRTDKFNPNGGLYYLDRSRGPAGTSELRVRVNRRYFFARSPFTEPALWDGQIVAGGESDPAVYGLTTKLRISLREGGYPGSVDLAGNNPVRTSSSVRLREDDRQFFELKRDQNRVSLDPYQGGWSVFVDGERLTSQVDLSPLSIIVVESRDANYRRNLIYLGPTRPVLAYVRWRNGERRRMYPEGGSTLVHMMGKAADVAAPTEAKLPPADKRLGSELALNLDVSLHQALQQILTRYASAHPNYSPFRASPNRLAVTVLDAHSGQVFALPSWPLLDPDKANYEALVDKIPEPTRSRFEDNHNLSLHVAGSTIKPLVFSAMATSLRQTGIDLAGVTVHNRRDSYSGRPPTVHPHLQVGGIRIGLWDCNNDTLDQGMRSFIVDSLDFPEGLLGILGMVNDEQEFARVLVRNDVSPDLTYRGARYRVDLTRASENATPFTIQDQLEGREPSTRGPEVVKGSVLYRQLESVFDFENSAQKDLRLYRAGENFLPSLSNPKLNLLGNNYLDNVIPQRLDMGAGDFQDIRGGLISCLLGGGECGFNNIMMAEAAARLVTGERVFARLEDVPAGAPPPLLGPIAEPGWRMANVIEPMRLVGEQGTADDMRSLVRQSPLYRVIYKTGTIVEGNEGRESETLMFVVGRWENGGFVAGETLAGYLYMEKSKVKNPPGGGVVPDGNMKKFTFAAPIINRLISHLQATRRTP